jgi:hypothetical protein
MIEDDDEDEDEDERLTRGADGGDRDAVTR